MSALGGILMFGGAPLDRDELASLGARLERLGPDGGREVIAGPVGMTYRAFHTNAESRREHQPYCRGHLAMLCFDGRLDNRSELLAVLGGDVRGDHTDAAIAMAAFLRWGNRGITKLVGDFALAVWDRRDGAVSLARDCAGTRTLYYHVDDEYAIWSSDLRGLLDVARMPIRVNDEYVAGFLTRGPAPGLTPYAGVRAVKPAHVVRIDARGRVFEERFWSLDPHSDIRYSTDAEYEEHFREVLRSAVRSRLRSDRPVFAELSGGLDSSSIVCVGDQILQAGEAAAPRLETVSYVFDDDPRADERKFIRYVEQRRGHRGHHLSDRQHPFFSPTSDHAVAAKPSVALFSSSFDRGLVATLQECHARVVLSGHGGDHLLLSGRDPGPELAALLRDGKFGELHRRAVRWAPVLRQPYVRVLLNCAIAPHLPPRIRASVLKSPAARLPRWFNRKFVAKHGLAAGRFGEQDVSRFPVEHRSLSALFETAVQQIDARPRQEFGGLEVAYPYLDRSLVEFLLAIPFEQKLRPEQNRSVMRRALRHLVPVEILARTGKGDPAATIFRAMRHHFNSLQSQLAASRIVERGYVDPLEFGAALTRAAAGREPHSGTLMRVIALEFWLRLLDEHGAHPASTDEPAVRVAAIA